MAVIDTIALILVIIGGLNWGSVGIFNYDFVSALFGAGGGFTRTIFILVGIGALWCISLLFKDKR